MVIRQRSREPIRVLVYSRRGTDKKNRESASRMSVEEKKNRVKQGGRKKDDQRTD
jgi:hypothetical protein